MKGKYLLGGFFMALLGAAIALFAYTQLMERTPADVQKDTSGIQMENAQAYLTSLQQRQGQIDFTYAAEQTVHAVVHVHTKSVLGTEAQNPIMEFFYGRQPSRPREVQGYGSGVIVSADGYIITNNHVVEDAESVDVTLNDRRTYTAEVVGRDRATDLALLRIKGENFPYIRYGDSDRLKLGEWVLAVGNPFNLTSTVTAGIVSALQREVRAPNNFTIDHVIQTDAPINSGNSGGPLIDAEGRVIGVNSQIETANGSGGNVGIGFAVPSNTVKSVVAQLLENGRVDRAYVGVTLQEVDSQVARVLRLPAEEGVLVGAVQPGSPAAKAGIEGGDTQVVVAGQSYQLGGDMIVAIDGKDVTSGDALRESIAAHKPGDTVRLSVVHADGKKETIEVELGRVPERSTS